MNARANTVLGFESQDVFEKTMQLMAKAQAISDLIRCAAKTGADPKVVATAAWAAEEMLEEAGKLNGWC
jgi:hypothetical protein